VQRIIIYPEPGQTPETFLGPLPNNWHLPHVEVVRQLEKAGYEVHIWPCEVDAKKDIGLAFDFPRYRCVMPERAVCVMLEPPVVFPRQYERMNGLPFQRILTFALAFCDEKRVFYSPYPVVRYEGSLAPKRDRYICAVSSGGKDFPIAKVGELMFEPLYGARRQAYMSMGKNLHLYGWGWENDLEVLKVCSYRGPVENKILTMSRYEMAAVFENVEIVGYASEKYWDAIQAGCRVLHRGWIPDYPMSEAEGPAWAKRIVEHIEAG